ncbi:uncharacterized protein LOC132549316 [Ylistrum balloti]|uniref:uncharacterized protein LOC132549316 n=1 Tax=Ylistrum balloti TaxID=509963 RepID=UPI002905AD28|nr:uncharacterized protein LOC132549316 [Ylistrum balloti]
MRMDYRLSFAVIVLNVIVSPVLSASTTSSYENITSITTDSSSILPINNATTTLPPSDNGTTATLPVDNTTILITTEHSANYTGSTVTSGQTTQTNPVTITELPLSTTTSASSSGFDGGSFAGGIALGAGLALIMFGIACYCRRRSGYSNLAT